MTKEVYRVLSFKASLLLLASKPLNLLKAYNTRNRKLACKGLEFRRVAIFCKKIIYFAKERYCLKFSTPMTTEVYCVRQLKSSLAYLVSNHLILLCKSKENHGCNVTLPRI